MRIAVWHNLPSGGAKRALVDHVDGFLARGHEVAVWSTPQSAAEPPDFGSNPQQHIVDLAIDPRLRGGALAPWPIVRSRLNAMSHHLDEAASQINAHQPDVLYVGACRYFRTVDLASRVNVPAVLYLGEPYRWLYEALPTLPWALEPRRPNEALLRWARRRLRDAITIPGLRRQAHAEVVAARGFDRILVNSFYSRESVQRAYGISAQVCYLGIDAERLGHGAGPRTRQVLGLGAFVPEKGIERAVRAVASMAAPAAPLVWVGNVASASYRATIETLCDELGVDLTVHVGVSDRDLADLLASSSVLIYTPYLEPFGLAVLEASAAGLPVVAVAEGGSRETVVDGVNGLLVSSDDDLPRALDRVLADPDLAATLGSGGRVVVADRWTQRAAIDRIESHLVSVARDR